MNFLGGGWFATYRRRRSSSRLLLSSLRRLLGGAVLSPRPSSRASLSCSCSRRLFGRHAPRRHPAWSLDSGSFPSGHVANAATLAAVLAIIFVAGLGVVRLAAAYVVLDGCSAAPTSARTGSPTRSAALLIGAARRGDRLGAARGCGSASVSAKSAQAVSAEHSVAAMRILLVGAGGVGDAIAKIAARRDFFEHDRRERLRPRRARSAPSPGSRRSTATQSGRFVAAQIDASDPDNVAAVAREHRRHPRDERGRAQVRADHLRRRARRGRRLPRHGDEPVRAASRPTRTPRPGVKLGDDQFAQAPDWETAGRLALVGMGVEPGLSDVFARYAADHLFSEIDELGTRDGANLVVRDEAGNEIFAPSFSIWTTIEECLNPPVIWEKDARLVHDRAVQRAGGLRLPRGHRPGRVRQRRARGGAAHAALGRRRSA